RGPVRLSHYSRWSGEPCASPAARDRHLGRAAWALYALLPLIWLPAGVGAYCALRRFYPGAMLLAMQWAALAAISMMLGLMRWPSVHWHLAQLQPTATAEQQQVVAAVFDGLNTYLGNYIGEF